MPRPPRSPSDCLKDTAASASAEHDAGAMTQMQRDEFQELLRQHVRDVHDQFTTHELRLAKFFKNISMHELGRPQELTHTSTQTNVNSALVNALPVFSEQEISTP
eukprot:TRINITY_DN100549_c0_g1_i1.p1 TRINITY_DN100549_c0_g1~~TRINITY_DN100549_c0_g1_i1.p1  ORF type:complete len:114 (-),score=28.32 TRINITY_DN100549_c0_g1_i1:54-368(-)